MNRFKASSFKILEKLASFFGSIGINKKTPGVLAVYNFFYNLFWPYGKIIKVQGSKMQVDISGENIAMRRTLEAYSLNKIHEKSTTDLFKKIIKEGDVVVDLGANIGYFSLLASKLVGSKGKVFSFEPEPKNYQYLNQIFAISFIKFLILWGFIFFATRLLRGKNSKKLPVAYMLIIFIFIALSLFDKVEGYANLVIFKTTLPFKSNLIFLGTAWFIRLVRDIILLALFPLVYLIARDLQLKEPKKATTILFILYIGLPIIIFPLIPSISEVFRKIMYWLIF